MIKHPITYTNFDNKVVTEDFYFNLTKAELAKKMLTDEGVDEGLGDRLKQIGESKNPKLILETFESFLFQAYGERDKDGRFLKSEAISNSFSVSEAYSNLLFQMATDAEFAGKFINSIVPQDMQESVTNTAESIRAKSEAQMQGHNKPKEAPKFEQVYGVVPEETPEADDLAAFRAWQENQKQAGQDA